MRKKLGEILVELGYIGWDQIRKALDEGKGTGELIGDVLIRLGWIGEEQLNIALAVQSGAQLVDARFVNAAPEVLSLISADLARQHLLLPYAREGDILKVAMANPYDVLARDRLQQTTGLQIQPHIASREWLIKAIDFFYKTAATLDQEVDALISKARDRGTLGEEDETINSRLVELFIAKGVITGASDVHFEPDEKILRVYYRIDGAMHQEYLMPRHLHGGIITRIKVLSDIPIGDPNIPHDGRMIFHTGIQRIAIRVSTFPTQYGEAGVLRLLQRAEGVGEMEALGLTGDAKERFRKATHRPYGLILTTGPTGSGKTTTLYAALSEINTGRDKIITIEDPVEYQLAGVLQIPVNEKKGLTFARGLRSILRHDPDKIMVGEIRDPETAQIAIQSALTGHLVFTTVHANNVFDVIGRFMHMGVDPYSLVSALNGVLAQRLVRVNCPYCSTRVAPEAELLALSGIAGGGGWNFQAGSGCAQCRGSGYKGRRAIAELMRLNDELRELIVARAPIRQLKEAAARAGVRPLRHAALDLVRQGVSTLEEANRVTFVG